MLFTVSTISLVFATLLENWNDAPGRRDEQLENHGSNGYRRKHPAS